MPNIVIAAEDVAVGDVLVTIERRDRRSRRAVTLYSTVVKVEMPVPGESEHVKVTVRKIDGGWTMWLHPKEGVSIVR